MCPLTIRCGIEETFLSSCGTTPTILTPAALAEELSSPVTKSLRTNSFDQLTHCPGFQKGLHLDTSPAVSSKSSELDS